MKKKNNEKNTPGNLRELDREKAKAIREGLLADEPEPISRPVTKKKAANRTTEPGWSLTF